MNIKIMLSLLSSVYLFNYTHSQININEQQPNQSSDTTYNELIVLTSKSVITSSDLDGIKILHLNNQFLALQQDKLSIISDNHIDSSLRQISSVNLKKFLAEHDGYVKIQKDDEGDFHLEAFLRLRGGGILGANVGWYVGKFAVYGVSYGALGLVAACTGPGFKVVFPALIKTFAAPIEYASNVAACGTAIASAAATGPA